MDKPLTYVYLGDVVAFLKGANSHVAQLWKIPTVLWDAGVIVRLTQVFFYWRINSPLHVIRPGRLELLRVRTAAICKLTNFTNLLELRSLLCFPIVCCRFIPDLTVLSASLNSMFQRAYPHLFSLVPRPKKM